LLARLRRQPLRGILLAAEHLGLYGREFGVHYRSHSLLIVLLAVAGLWQQAAPVAAASIAEERAKLRTAETSTKKASKLYALKKYPEAGDAAREAQEALGELETSETKTLAQPLAAVRKSLSKVHDQLKAEKIDLPDLPPAVLSAKAGKRQAVAADKTSFTKQVTPILLNRCGKCHVEHTRGELSMASYAQLMQGSKNGLIVQPGNGKGSRLYEVIESTDMPRGGGTVPAEELALLVRWIDEGAPFDGRNPGDRLEGAPPASATPDPPAAAAKTPPSKGSPAKMATAEKSRSGAKGASAPAVSEVSFSRDLAPVFEQCVGCHGDRNPRGGINIESFSSLMRGGTNGSPVSAGNPSGSLLIEKLLGKAEGQRMPAGKPPLSAETIAKIEQWIAAGANFDGTDPGMTMSRLVAVTHAQAASHKELMQDRVLLTEKNWHLVLPDSQADRNETEHFLVFGNVNAEELADVARQAEAQVPKLEKILKVPTGEPLIKGRMTIFVFQKHYDYDEIGTMLEHREIPPESRGHWRYDVVDAYAAIVPPKNSEYAIDALLAQQIASVYVASQGHVPHWFADGSGRAVAAKINPKDSRVRQWESRLTQALGDMSKPTDLLDGKLNQSDSDAVSFGFARYLMSNTSRYYAVLSSLKGGTKFDDAFAKAYGGPPKQVIESWIQHGGGGKRSR
jgi:mono/diheme cytochrome c family protein